MWNAKLKALTLIVVCQFFFLNEAIADEIKIAVASNFYPTMKELVTHFESITPNSDTTNNIVLISGSSGKHYAQILNGAPFDLFFSADKLRPNMLEKEEVFNNQSRFTYALGKLALWSPFNEYVDSDGQVLYNDDFRFIAIANPRIAPYGIASKETLTSMNLWQDMEEKLVRGENIAQTFQFAKSGNAKLGFVSYSQILSLNSSSEGSYWLVPQDMYQPIEQQAILLKDSSLGKDFLSFIMSDEALDIIKRNGYDLP
ncbi:MAG: molybdate ABC transporter substrate-binding protein [Candidatus Pseudothioglobus sp.]|jgi:molybdate transport system substrate-binding protein